VTNRFGGNISTEGLRNVHSSVIGVLDYARYIDFGNCKDIAWNWCSCDCRNGSSPMAFLIGTQWHVASRREAYKITYVVLPAKTGQPT